MPGRDVATIKDPIYYQYAKIKAKSAFAASDGERVKFYYLSHIEELPFNHINRYKERAVAV
jgi:hypothetical protein